MFKRLILFSLAAGALAVPGAALAENSPAPSPGEKPAAAERGHRGGPGQKLGQANRRMHKLAKRCRKADAAQRAECVQRIVKALDQAEARLDKIAAKVKERCAAANPPKACSRAEKFLQRLEKVRQRIEKLRARIQQQGSAGSSPSSSSDLDSVSSLDAALEAVEAQQP